MRTAKTLIRLGECPGWSESSLGANSLCWFCHVAAHIASACGMKTEARGTLLVGLPVSRVRLNIFNHWPFNGNCSWWFLVRLSHVHVACFICLSFLTIRLREGLGGAKMLWNFQCTWVLKTSILWCEYLVLALFIYVFILHPTLSG